MLERLGYPALLVLSDETATVTTCRVQVISRKGSPSIRFRGRSDPSSPGSRWEKPALWSSAALGRRRLGAGDYQRPSSSRRWIGRRSICFATRSAAEPLRRGGSGGGYWEVNKLPDLAERIVPFFDRFRLAGTKDQDFQLFRSAVKILSRGCLTDSDFRAVLTLRERMNRGGKRRYSMARILRDYTPGPLPE